jgi:hypothetical protein
MAVKQFYYNEQLKKWIVQFANIFAGLQIKTGKQSDRTTSHAQLPGAIWYI